MTMAPGRVHIGPNTSPRFFARITIHSPTAVTSTTAMTEASSPNDPPDSQFGPDSSDRTSPLAAIPDTGTPKMKPWVKFHAAWRPIGSHRLRVSI